MGSKVHRTTVSIPLDLKEQMDAVAGEVNWSSVAVSAFRAKLWEIQSRKVKSMPKEDVVNRLRETMNEVDPENYAAGKEAGRRWAESTAKAKELKRLLGYINYSELDLSISWWDVDYEGWAAPHGAPGALVEAVWPRRTKDEGKDAHEEFWETALGAEKERRWDADFLHGFGDGALEVWEEVEGQL